MGGLSVADVLERAEFRVKYPFVRETVWLFGEDGPYETKSWRPGVNIENQAPYENALWAESEGEMVLTVVDIHKSGRFPTRVFYTRQFVNPDGMTFGKSGLKICTLEKFRRIATRYQVDYDAEESFEQAAERRREAASLSRQDNTHV